MISSFIRQAGPVAECYLSGFPDPATGAAGIFAELAAALRGLGARILHERIFVQGDDQPALAEARRTAYGELDDGVDPTWLASPAGRTGRCAAVQIHAVIGGPAPEAQGRHIRILRHGRGGVMTLSAVVAPGSQAVPDQCRTVFAEAAAGLAGRGVAMTQIARTWLWLDPIHTWYADLNRVRNQCFTAHGLIAADGKAIHLPASTGIGLRPAGAAFALEAIATLDGSSPTMLPVAGNQRSALGYGSAFSRAACLDTPSGETWYVSGTAAIDADGHTVALGDITRQVQLTIDNVRAVLLDIEAEESDIVLGVAYCLSPEVAEAWRRADPGWPLASVQADICRSNLLFEIEITVCPGARSLR